MTMRGKINQSHNTADKQHKNNQALIYILIFKIMVLNHSYASHIG